MLSVYYTISYIFVQKKDPKDLLNYANFAKDFLGCCDGSVSTFFCQHKVLADFFDHVLFFQQLYNLVRKGRRPVEMLGQSLESAFGFLFFFALVVIEVKQQGQLGKVDFLGFLQQNSPNQSFFGGQNKCGQKAEANGASNAPGNGYV